jgi:hypothetical protein
MMILSKEDILNLRMCVGLAEGESVISEETANELFGKLSGIELDLDKILKESLDKILKESLNKDRERFGLK